MNIPDGFIPLWQCVIYGIIILISWIFTFRWVVKSIIKLEKKNPSTGKIIFYIFLLIFLMGFVFGIQSFNIPVPYGVGIGLLGAALVAIIFRSPWGAVLIMSPVIIVQSILLGDGGLTTLGVNILNVGVIAGFTGFYIYELAKPLGRTARALVGGWFAGFLSIVISSVAVALEMWLAGTFPLFEGITFMTAYSAAVGVVEGIMTIVGCFILLILRSKK